MTETEIRRTKLKDFEAESESKLPEIHEDPIASHHIPTPQKNDAGQHVSLPEIKEGDISSKESLIKALGLAETDEKSLGRLLKGMRGKVTSTLGELRTITTHDDNLERQYKEVLSENTQLNSALEKARGEIRHLKGQLSVLQMTAPEIRKHRARIQLRKRRKADHEYQIQRSRSKYIDEVIPLLNSAERACTVNARGEYIEYRQSVQAKRSTHSRHSTYPPPIISSPLLIPPLGHKSDPLPPPLLGCSCSFCNSKQSLGALTLGSKHQQHVTKSGQQILLGDRVIIKGEKPVGTSNGSLKGRYYFQCPVNHGVFVRASEVTCVTGRKSYYVGTTVARKQERLPSCIDRSRSSIHGSKPNYKKQKYQSPTPLSSHAASSMTQAHTIVESELAMIKNGRPLDLFDESVQEMSRMITILSNKNKPEPVESDEPQTSIQYIKMENPGGEILSKQESDTTEPQLSNQTVPSEHVPDKRSPSPTHTCLIQSTPPLEQPPLEQPHLERTPSPLFLSNCPAPASKTPSAESTSTGRDQSVLVERPATPLETTLLNILRSKDLGSTGFVTAKELETTLLQLPQGNAMAPEKCSEILMKLGISTSDAGGISYQTLMPYLMQAINDVQ